MRFSGQTVYTAIPGEPLAFQTLPSFETTRQLSTRPVDGTTAHEPLASQRLDEVASEQETLEVAQLGVQGVQDVQTVVGEVQVGHLTQPLQVLQPLQLIVGQVHVLHSPQDLLWVDKIIFV